MTWLNIQKLSLVFCLFFLAACGDEIEDLSSTLVPLGAGEGGTSGGTGTGGGVELDGVIQGVDYKQIVSEDKIGLPDDPSKLLRKTVISFDIELDMSAIEAATTRVTRTENFDLDTSQYYKITLPNLEVLASNQQSLAMAIYLLPIQAGTGYFLETFVTLNDIGYSLLRSNSPQTAFYVKGAYNESLRTDIADDNTGIIKSTILNADKLDVPDNAVVPTHWHGGLLSLEPVNPRHLPTHIKFPCYKDHLSCATTSGGSQGDNNDKSFMLFQPIASIGYNNFDWFDYNYTTQALQDFVVTAQPLPDDTNGQLIRQLGIDETLQKLKLVFEGDAKKHNQIGWYGLPEDTRSKMIRYHTTKMMINLKDTTTGDTILTVPENSLHITHYTEGLDTDKTPKQVTHAAQTFSLTN